jgi:predicted amino acid dehydrogenase
MFRPVTPDAPNRLTRNRTRSCRQRGDLDGIAEVLKSGDEALGLGGFGATIEVVRAQVLIAGAVLEHVIDGCEDGSGKSAYDAQRNVEPKTLSLPIDDLGSDETGDKAEYDPTNNAHVNPPYIATEQREL